MAGLSDWNAYDLFLMFSSVDCISECCVFLGKRALQFQRICLFVWYCSTAHAVLSFSETVASLVTFDDYCFVDVLGSSSKKNILLLPPNFTFSFYTVCLHLA